MLEQLIKDLDASAEEYLKVVYRGITLNPVQHKELKQAFISGIIYRHNNPIEVTNDLLKQAIATILNMSL